jgi:hypothetical protein
MASSYKGNDLFGSGAHRFVIGRQGRRVISLAAITNDASVAGAAEFGDLELRIEVRGRLVAIDEPSLWVLRDALMGEAVSTVGSGVLEDQWGHQWATMKLLSVEEVGPTARGRVVSVGYTAVFGRLATG